MSAFFFWMLLSSGLGFLKMLALAQIMPRRILVTMSH